MNNPKRKKLKVSSGKPRRWRMATPKTKAPNAEYDKGWDTIDWDR